jgi:hypothetical protein
MYHPAHEGKSKKQLKNPSAAFIHRGGHWNRIQAAVIFGVIWFCFVALMWVWRFFKPQSGDYVCRTQQNQAFQPAKGRRRAIIARLWRTELICSQIFYKHCRRSAANLLVFNKLTSEFTLKQQVGQGAIRVAAQSGSFHFTHSTYLIVLLHMFCSRVGEGGGRKGRGCFRGWLG